MEADDEGTVRLLLEALAGVEDEGAGRRRGGGREPPDDLAVARLVLVGPKARAAWAAMPKPG